MELYAICAEKCLLLERDDADDDLKSEEGDERTLADLEYPTEILRRRSSFKKRYHGASQLPLKLRTTQIKTQILHTKTNTYKNTNTHK